VLTFTSTMEVILFLISLMMFRGNIWFNVLALSHLLRSLIGVWLSRLIPYTHEMTQRLDFDDHEKQQLQYAQTKPLIFRLMKTQVMEFYDDYELPALIYQGNTALCLFFDALSSFILLGMIGSSSKDSVGGFEVEPQFDAETGTTSYDVAQVTTAAGYVA